MSDLTSRAQGEAERLRPVTGVADDWERRDNLLWGAGFTSGASWAATHAPSVEALTAEVERLRDFKLGTEVMRWPEEAHRQHAAASDARAQRDALAARLDRLRAGLSYMTTLMSEAWKDPRIASAKGTYGRGAGDVVADTVQRVTALLAEDEATGRGEGA